jgi:hypothetical protein
VSAGVKPACQWLNAFVAEGGGSQCLAPGSCQEFFNSQAGGVVVSLAAR